MRLTESIRSAFVKAVLDDVPQTDYHTQMQDLLNKEAIAQAPEIVQRAYKAHPEFFSPRSVHVVTSDDNEIDFWATVPLGGDVHTRDDFKFRNKDDEVAYVALDVKNIQQQQDLQDLQRKLWATINGFNTVEQVRKALPEFEKYLPDPEAKTDRTVPAVANLVTDLVKLGWPKGKKPDATPPASDTLRKPAKLRKVKG